MQYMVMECHMGYAVVLDENGRFLKVANINYKVGQSVTSVIEMEKKTAVLSIKYLFLCNGAIAACVCAMLLAAWQLVLTPCGTIRMQINPDIEISLNKLDFVIGLEGKNADGEKLIQEYSFRMKKTERVLDELADKAVELNYLSDGGTIYLDTLSKNKKWEKAKNEQVIDALREHFNDKIEVNITSHANEEQTEDTNDRQELYGNEEGHNSNAEADDDAWEDNENETSDVSDADMADEDDRIDDEDENEEEDDEIEDDDDENENDEAEEGDGEYDENEDDENEDEEEDDEIEDTEDDENENDEAEEGNGGDDENENEEEDDENENEDEDEDGETEEDED